MASRDKKSLHKINVITGICGVVALAGAVSLGMLEEKRIDKREVTRIDDSRQARRDQERRAARMAEPAIADSTNQ